MQDPAVSDLYNEHPSEATVARYSPSGFYICSADIQGNVCFAGSRSLRVSVASL